MTESELLLEGLDVQGLESKLWRKSRSLRTITTFQSAVNAFNIFAKEKGISLKDDPYKIIDSFVAYLDEKNYSARTINNYTTFIVRLLKSNNFGIRREDLREKITLPKIAPFQDSTLETETAKKIILNCKHETLKIILLLMKDTAARPSELLSLSLGDFNLTHDPPYLTIPSYAAKNDIPRENFFTNETKQVLMDYIKNKGISKANQFLFLKEDLDPITDEKGFQIAVRKALCHIENAFTFLISKPTFEEIRGVAKQRGRVKRKKIHIYSFKKFAFTKIADTLGSLAAHAIAGHEEYLITYYKKSRAERAKDYLKVIPKLRLFTPSEDEELRDKAMESIRELPREALVKILKIAKKSLKG